MFYVLFDIFGLISNLLRFLVDELKLKVIGWSVLYKLWWVVKSYLV